MKACETCGNQYEKAFEVIVDGQSHTFDSFECAINQLAPRCNHCQCSIIGHGVEVDNEIFCCAHCANNNGYTGIRDHVDSTTRQKMSDMVYESGIPMTAK